MTEISALAAHPRNYNRHSAGQVADLARSLTRFGQRKPVVVWRGVILAGHGLVEAARSLGWSEIWTAEAPAEWTEAEALAFVAADNELARAADPDEDALAALVAELGDVDEELARLAAGGDEALKRLLASIAQPAGEDPGAQIDKAEELRVKWGVETGQLWALGEHRLVCGDCTDAAVVGRLMGGEVGDLLLTDPPYNVGIEYGAGTNDRKTLEQNEAFITKWFECYKAVPVKVVTPGAGFYLGTLRSWLTLWPPRWMCIWVRKNSMSHSPLRGYQAWEPILFYAHEEDDAETDWGGALVYGKVKKSIKQDVFTIPVGVQKDVADEHGNKLHPTPKPRELFEVLLRAFSEIGQIVVDPFLGSGTTVIAAENLGRRARCIEISPGYVAVALERWAVMTGQTPVLVDVAAAVHDAPGDDE